MNTETITIKTDYIQLGQFLKLASIVDTGGSVKPFLSETPVFVNDEQDQRRGRKLYSGDLIVIEDIGIYRIVKK